MEYKSILVEYDTISNIVLNRPEKRNALSPSMLAEMKEAIQTLGKSSEVKVIILKGAGKGFCAGADLTLMAADDGIMKSLEMKTQIMDLLTIISKTEKVVISQLHGFALAGGFGIGMAADLVTVSEDCKLGMPEIKRGLGPMNIMNPLDKCMPRRKLLEMIYTGCTITAQEAAEWGLINRIVAADRLDEATLELAQSIACNSGSALKLCKSAFYNMQNMDFYTAFQYLTEHLTINSMTLDAKEGIEAFLEKREPVWTNR